eukprot:gene15434-biopygen7090
MVLKRVGDVPVSTVQDASEVLETCECLESSFGPVAGSAIVLLTRRPGCAGMPWGLVVDDRMELTGCTVGSVAISNARAQACVGKVLTKVNGKPVHAGDWEGFAKAIQGVDVIGLHFRHPSISDTDSDPSHVL